MEGKRRKWNWAEEEVAVVVIQSRGKPWLTLQGVLKMNDKDGVREMALQAPMFISH